MESLLYIQGLLDFESRGEKLSFSQKSFHLTHTATTTTTRSRGWKMCFSESPISLHDPPSFSARACMTEIICMSNWRVVLLSEVGVLSTPPPPPPPPPPPLHSQGRTTTTTLRMYLSRTRCSACVVCWGPRRVILKRYVQHLCAALHVSSDQTRHSCVLYIAIYHLLNLQWTPVYIDAQGLREICLC